MNGTSVVLVNVLLKICLHILNAVLFDKFPVGIYVLAIFKIRRTLCLYFLVDFGAWLSQPSADFATAPLFFQKYRQPSSDVL